MEHNKRKATCGYRAVLTAALSAVILTVLFAEVRYTGSDPRGSFLLSETLLTSGSMKLDHYGEETLASYGYVVHQKNEHFYYFFPIGTSIVSIPAVALAKLIGLDIREQEENLQIILAAICAGLTVLAFYGLAQLFLAPAPSVLIALLFWFGTSLASTGGAALWSHNFAVLFSLLAIYCAVRYTFNKHGILFLPIALSLFVAYLCRPTFALLVPFLLLFVLSYDKKMAAKTAVVFAALFLGFVLISFLEFRQILPDYYLPGRLEGSDFAVALLGNLASPSRGVLVFSPFILVFILRMLFCEWNLTLKKSWLLIGLAWPLLHLLAISRFFHWWGGWSYGARFMTDIIPGLFLLGINGWPSNLSLRQQVFSKTALIVTALFSFYVNTYQGLFNKYTGQWNAKPNINFFPSYLFDWKYPQFLSSKEMLEKRLIDHSRKFNLDNPVIEINVDDSSEAKFSGWEESAGILRWNDSFIPSLAFVVNTDQEVSGQLVIDAGYAVSLNVSVSLNGVLVHQYAAPKGGGPRTLVFDPGILQTQGWNKVEFGLAMTGDEALVNNRVFSLRKLVIK